MTSALTDYEADIVAILATAVDTQHLDHRHQG